MNQMTEAEAARMFQERLRAEQQERDDEAREHKRPPVWQPGVNNGMPRMRMLAYCIAGALKGWSPDRVAVAFPCWGGGALGEKWVDERVKRG